MEEYVIFMCEWAISAGHGSQGEGKGRGLVILKNLLAVDCIYTPRGPRASADFVQTLNK